MRSEDAVGARTSNSVAAHAVGTVQTRSVVAVGGVYSYSELTHALRVRHPRSVVAVDARNSYWDDGLQAVNGEQTVSLTEQSRARKVTVGSHWVHGVQVLL